MRWVWAKRKLSHVSLSAQADVQSIQTIALLLSEPRRKPSLVVAPVVALMQWKHEIETHAEGFKVYLWHGQTKVKSAELKKYDVVSLSIFCSRAQAYFRFCLRTARSRQRSDVSKEVSREATCSSRKNRLCTITSGSGKLSTPHSVS